MLPDILLLVAEHADARSIIALSHVCKAFYTLLNQHERSIAAMNVQNHPELLYRPVRAPWSSGYILSSATEERPVIPLSTYAGLCELHLRASRVHWVFHSFHANPLQTVAGELCDHLGGRNNLPAFIDGLQRAVLICDRIADCGADITVRAQREANGWILKNEESSRSHPGNHEALAQEDNSGSDDSDAQRSGLRNRPEGTAGGSESSPLSETAEQANREAKEPLANKGHAAVLNDRDLDPRTRIYLARRALVRDLPLVDIAFLLQLSSLACMAFERQRPRLTMAGDPMASERKAAFQEVLLTHGSLVLWAVLGNRRGGAREALPLKQFVSECIEGVMGDIEVYEAGEPGALPGIYSKLVRGFTKKSGCAPGTMWQEVDRITVGGSCRHGA